MKTSPYLKFINFVYKKVPLESLLVFEVNRLSVTLNHIIMETPTRTHLKIEKIDYTESTMDRIENRLKLL